MAMIGYGRVSSVGQSLDVQVERLTMAGVVAEHLHTEKLSGKDRDRPALKQALMTLRSGDVFVVTKIDRLARSTSDLLNIIKEIEAKGASFKVLDQSIDTATSSGRLTLSILASVAEFELSIRAERQADGIRKAMVDPKTKLGARVAQKGSRQVEVKRLHAEKRSIKEIMELTGISKASVYRLLEL